jgi:hypothetical protein
MSHAGAGGERSLWWIKLAIDIDSPLAWRAVQELAHVLNCLSLDEPLATSFKPVSPPPYMNGGPALFLSWIVENTDATMSPERVAEWLEARLPAPVDDVKAWEL